MADPKRIPPETARDRVESGTALLVCAYDSKEKCEKNRLEGALSLDELKSREKSLSKDQELIFYCA